MHQNKYKKGERLHLCRITVIADWILRTLSWTTFRKSKYYDRTRFRSWYCKLYTCISLLNLLTDYSTPSPLKILSSDLFSICSNSLAILPARFTDVLWIQSQNLKPLSLISKVFLVLLFSIIFKIHILLYITHRLYWIFLC